MCFEQAAGAVGTEMNLQGSILQMYSQSRKAKAHREAIERERLRQIEFQRKARQEFLQSVGVADAGNMIREQRIGAEKRTKDYRAAVSDPGAAKTPEAVQAGSGANVTNRSVKANNAKADAFIDELLTAAAKMGGTSDAFAGAGRGMAENARNIGIIGGNAGRSIGILPVDLAAAQDKGYWSGLFGDILVGLGGQLMGSGNAWAGMTGGSSRFNPSMAQASGSAMQNNFGGGGLVSLGAGNSRIQTDAAGRILGGI